MNAAQLAILKQLVALRRARAEADLAHVLSQSAALRAEAAAIARQAAATTTVDLTASIHAIAQFDAWAARSQGARLGMAKQLEKDAQPVKTALSRVIGQQDALEDIDARMADRKARKDERREDERIAQQGAGAKDPDGRFR